MDRCALFVDAGYVLADGAMAVHGTRHRESVSWNYPALLQFLGTLARDRSGLPLLRCYWYEATVEGRRSPEHEILADLPGVKLRLGRMRPGHREGVESEVHRDLITLARNGAVCDAFVVSAEEELAQAVAEVQDLGVRVTMAHIAVDGEWTISRALRQECDDIAELTQAQLRPYVDFVPGTEPVREDKRHPAAGYPGHVRTNGHAPVSQLGQQGLPVGSPPAAEIYTAPVIAEYQRSAQPMPNGQPGPVPSPQHAGPAAGQVRGPAPAPQRPEPIGGVPGPQVLPSGQPAGPPAASPAQHSPQLPSSVPQPPTAPPGQHASQGVPPGQPGYPAGYPGSVPDLPPQPGQHQAMPGTQHFPAPGQPGEARQSGPIGQVLPDPAAAPAGQLTQAAPDRPPGQQFPGPAGDRPGPYGGQQPAPPRPLVAPPPVISVADAVQAAYGEGFTFGQAVGREAEQLWLEAVLARKPRMPSDLEARLLKDSALPIDSLLHDEVRHALRRGFWDALERARH